MTNLRAGLVGLACTLGACGGNSITLDALPAQESAAVCALEQRCLGLGYAVLIGDADCAASVAHGLENGPVASIRTAVAGGTLAYHEDLAPACLDAIRDADCAEITHLDGLAACDAAVSGTVAPGGRCSIDVECTGDAYCRRPAATMPMGTTCPGTCTARVGAGQHCTQLADCTTGLYCDRSSTCTPPATLGEPCQGAAGKECAPGLECVGDTMTVSGTCRSSAAELSAAEGASCDVTNGIYCIAGLSCMILAVGAMPPQQCARPVAAGAACKIALPEMCPAGQYCLQAAATATDGTCTPLPAVGSPCRMQPIPGLTLDECLGDAVCVTDGSGNSTCRARAANGTACGTDRECWSGRCMGGTCVAPEICM